MRREGFTLIELLVVIAIIAILAMLLFPVFVKVMADAKTSKCIAHGHQLVKACFMYMDDANGRFPRSLTQGEINVLPRLGPYDWPGTPMIDEAPNGRSTWDPGNAQYRLVQLKPYVRNKDIWICPSPKGDYTTRYAYGKQCSWLPRSSDDFVDGDRGFVNPKTLGGYTIAEVQGLDQNNKDTMAGNRYLPPSKKIMWMCYAFGEYGNSLIASGGTGWRQNMFPDYPHGDGTVFVYADGHAARKRMGKGWAPVKYTTLWMDQDPGQ